MKKWPLDGPGYQEPGSVGARGSGLPLFGGLIRPGELEAGLIEHLNREAARLQRRYLKKFAPKAAA